MEEINQISEMSMKDKMNFLMEKAVTDSIKTKKMKIPRKAKISKGQAKKGWIGIIRVDQNGNITGEKQKVEGSTVRLGKGPDKTYHSITGKEIVFWEGKHPVIIQKVWEKNPIQLRKDLDEKDETYGQKYIMARMIGDTIKTKGGGGKGLLWVVGIGVVLYLGYMLVTGQF